MSPEPNPHLEEVTGQDLTAYLALQAVTYNDNQDWGESTPIEGRRLFLLCSGGKPIGGYAGIEFNTQVQNRCVSTVGYQMVSILPEERNSGNGKSLMRESLQLHAKEGKALAALYAFSEEFYRQCGFEVCGHQVRIKCDLGFLPALKVQLQPHRPSQEEWECLKPCYQEFSSRRSGLTERTDFLWQRKLKNKAVLTFGDPMESYLIVDLKTQFYSTLDVQELVWTTERGYESAVGFFRKLAINKSHVQWTEPPDSPFVSRYIHTGGMTSVEIGTKVMMRCLSVSNLLKGLPCSQGFHLRLQVKDDLISENNGCFELSESGGMITVSKTESADLELNIGTLTQLVLGYLDVGTLCGPQFNQQREGSFSKLAELFPKRSSSCMDFY